MTTDQVVDLIRGGYVSRGQAPAPAEKIGCTPLWKRSEIVEWANNRVGVRAPTSANRAGAAPSEYLSFL
nr:transcriptional regulator [Rhodococcus opacus]